ncbi:MAG TPA: hypothetical protein VGF99_10975, partial [Myxococcota bacterium]
MSERSSSTCGYVARKRATSGTTYNEPKATEALTRRRPRGATSAPVAIVRSTSSMSARIRRERSRYSAPSTVGCRVRVVRTSSGVPRRSSRRVTSLLTADGDN